MAINLFTVQSDAESKGWKLLSDSYKNLKSPLDWLCPKGHQIEDTYENWRKHSFCPLCASENQDSIVRNKILPKKNPSDYRVIALDAATGTTGYSVFDNKKLVAYGTFSTIYSDDAASRINQVKHWLEESCKIWQPDAIGLEGIQYQKERGIKTFQTLANLQGVLVDFFYENNKNFDYKVFGSSTWRSYLGLNNADKRENAKQKAQSYVKMLFHINPTQDEADAICIGYYCMNQFRGNKKITWGEDIL